MRRLRTRGGIRGKATGCLRPQGRRAEQRRINREERHRQRWGNRNACTGWLTFIAHRMQAVVPSGQDGEVGGGTRKQEAFFLMKTPRQVRLLIDCAYVSLCAHTHTCVGTGDFCPGIVTHEHPPAYLLVVNTSLTLREFSHHACFHSEAVAHTRSQ